MCINITIVTAMLTLSPVAKAPAHILDRSDGLASSRSDALSFHRLSDARRHHHYEGAVIHVQPIASSNEFIRSVSCERAIGVSAKVGFVRADHKPEFQ
jgi:hypothetical protein